MNQMLLEPILFLMAALARAAVITYYQDLSSSVVLILNSTLDAKPIILPIPESPLSISLTMYPQIPLPISPSDFLKSEFDELMLKPFGIITRAYLKTENGLTLHLHLDRYARIRNLDLAGACEIMERFLRAKGKASTVEFWLLTDDGLRFADGGLEPAVAGRMMER